MNLKKTIFTACCFTLLLAFISCFGCGAVSAAEEVYTLEISVMFNYPDPICYGWDTFKKLVEERSGGRIKANVHQGGVISASDVENSQMVYQNSIQMTGCPAYTLYGLNPQLTRFNICDFPYLIGSFDELNAFGDSEIFAGMLEELREKTGIKGYPLWAVGWSDIGTTKKTEVIDDLKGQNIRVAGSAFRIQLMESLQANITPMAFDEVYTALQQGVVDGALSPTSFWQTSKFGEVVDYLFRIKSNIQTHVAIVNDTWYSALPPDLQAIFDECVLEMIAQIRADEVAFEEAALQYCRDQGVTIVELSPEELQKGKDITRHIWTSLADTGGGAEFLAQVNTWFEEYRKNNP